MNLLLDTGTPLWAWGRSEKLSRRLQGFAARAAQPGLVGAASARGTASRSPARRSSAGETLYRLGYPNREVRQSLNERLLRAADPDASRQEDA